jgi:CRISPR-associated endonuclease/helicase Cas3
VERFAALGLTPPGKLEVHPPDPPAWIGDDDLQMEFLLRMLFSALVDADGLDSERHGSRTHAGVRDLPWPPLDELEQRFQASQHQLEAEVAANRLSDTPVNQVRRDVYEACLAGAALPPGFFRLTVPTGGGKTRSGLAFALRHAIAHGLRRVIVAVPFITITEQTADVYEQAFGDAHGLIEHHSGIEQFRDDPDGGEDPDQLRRRLASQNWDAPVIVTTTVQLFESLFTNRISKVRKLHNIAGSVIILDEIQTLPPEMRGTILDVLRELVAHYRVSVVLSTATQPVLDTIAADLDRDGRGIVELAPEPERLFATLKRVEYDLPCLDEVWDWERVADEMRTRPRAMTIVNTIADAAALFKVLDDENALHLSTRMCGAHRRAVLADVRKRLKAKEPCRLVSTQLVEAGVDLDFPLVLRALAPLDRIVQAAGRCNREGQLERPGRVVVFRTEENAMPPGVYRQGADETLLMLRLAGLDMHDPAIFQSYFSGLYGLVRSDRKNIQDQRRRFNYETVNDEFRMIDDNSFPVLVPYPAKMKDEAQTDRWNRARDAIEHYQPGRGPLLRRLMRDVQPWLVMCRNWNRERYEQQGTIVDLGSGMLWEWRDDYDERLGITDLRLAPESLLLS